MADAAADWAIDRLFGEEPAPICVSPHLLDGDGADPHGADAESGQLPPEEHAAARSGDRDDVPTADVDAGAKRAAVWLGAGVTAASVVIVGVFTFSGGSDPSSPASAAAQRPAAAVAAAPRTSTAVTAPDQAIPFTAEAPGCKGGSTAAQVLSDSTGDAAWVCVRGTPDEQADGQVLHVDFRCDAPRPAAACSYLVDSVSVTPGSVTKTPDGQDDWLGHRVVSRLQYNFYNGGQLAEILTQDTGNVHGPVTTDLRHPVLASQVVVIVLQTARPPAAPSPTAVDPGAAPPRPGLIDPGETTAPGVSNPVDATFAISAMAFLGHRPS